MPEFGRSVLETLRQPMEDGQVTIARAHGSVQFPARFTLVAAMNPTPSGQSPNDPVSHRQMQRYLDRVSGPLINQIDIHMEVPEVSYGQLTSQASGTDSCTMRHRVVTARQRQTQRNGSTLKPNCELGARELDRFSQLDKSARMLLKQAMTKLGLSARAYDMSPAPLLI